MKGRGGTWWVDGCMDEWMDGPMDEWMNGRSVNDE